MATLNSAETAFASVLRAMFPQRDIVRGKRGEGAEPARKFMMWFPDVSVPIGKPRSRYEGGNQITEQLHRLEFVVSFDGGDAYQDALNFSLCWGQSQRYSDAFKVFGFLGTTQLADLSAPQFAKFKTRADLRVLLSVKFTLTTAPEIVEVTCVNIQEPSHGYEREFCLDKQEPPDHECSDADNLL